jgi:hypothetical protein
LHCARKIFFAGLHREGRVSTLPIPLPGPERYRGAVALSDGEKSPHEKI